MTNHPIIQPLLNAITKAKQGDVSGARVELQVSSSTLDDSDLRIALSRLERAVVFCQQSDLAQAARSFAGSQRLIANIGVTDTREILEIYSVICQAVDQLQNADAVGAFQTLQSITTRLEAITSRYPDLGVAIYAVEAIAYSALANFHMARGDFTEVERVGGLLSNVYDQALEYAQQNTSAGAGTYVEVYGNKLEFILNFCFRELVLLQIPDARNRIKTGEEARNTLSKYITEIPNSTFRSVVNSILESYNALSKIIEVAFIGIEKKEKISKEEFSKLEQASDLLFLARQHAISAGNRGIKILNYIDSCITYLNGMIKLLTPSKWDILKYGGPIFGITYFFIVLLGIWVGVDSYVLFIGATFPSLITGFGYGALKFIPLIRSFEKLLNKK